MRQFLPSCLLLIATAAFAQDVAARIHALIAEGDRQSAEAVRRFDLALKAFTQADALAASSHDAVLRATARQRRCQGLFNMSRLAEAVRVCQEASALARSAGADAVLGNAIRATGSVFLMLGRFEEAETALTEAAEISSRHGTPDQTARALLNLSANARNQGKLGDAIEYGRRAVEWIDRGIAAGAVFTPRALFAAPFNLGKAMADAGDYLDSRTYLDRAFAVAEQHNDIGGQMHMLFDTGEWYEVLGETDRAIRYYERSASFSRGHNSGEEGVAKSLRGLGRIMIARQRYDAAVRYLTEAIDILSAAEIGHNAPLAMIDLSRARARAGESVVARRQLDRAIALARRHDHSAAIVLGLIERGYQDRVAGRLDEAVSALREAVEEAGRSRLLPLVPAAYAGIGAIAEQSGDLSAAVIAYEQAADALGRIHGRISSIELRASFSAATHDTFAGLVRVLLASHDRDPAAGFDRRVLDVLERERSHALALALIDARTVAASTDRGAATRIAEIQYALFAPEVAADRRATLLRALDDAERDLALASAYQSRGIARLTSVKEMQARLKPGEAVLQYIISPTRADVFVIRAASLRHQPLKAATGMAERVEFFERALESGTRDASLASGAALASLLIDPVMPLLDDVRHLHVIASGPLARLPFHALPLTGARGPEPLLARYSVSLLPSFALIAARGAEAPGPGRGVLAIADAGGAVARSRNLAPLPGSRVEVGAVSRRHRPSRILAGAEATESAVKAAAAQPYSIIHLATHALLDPVVPERSAVLLGAEGRDDGLLQPREILAMSFDGSVIVLSGCSTAAGAVSGAEGLRSLARAFLQAGAGSVVGSLWALPDATATSMVTRVSDYLADGDDVGSALRAAQLAQAGADPYAASRTWAAMTVLGDPSLRTGGVPARNPWVTAGLAFMGMAAIAWYASRRRTTSR